MMTYRTAADVLAQMFPVDAGKHHETMRRHTLKVGEALGGCAAIRPEAAASAIAVTLDATFIRSCAEGERHLEVRVGNVEAQSGGRQVFGAVAKAGTQRGAGIRGTGALTPTPPGVRRRGRSSGVRDPACG